MDKKIHLLDCTLRDGAHLNKGFFGKTVIKETVKDLVRANIDIIEVGFFDNGVHDDNCSYFSSIEEVKRILPSQKGNSHFALMADFVDVSQVEPCDGTVEFFRLSFKRNRLEWGLEAARILMEKGYKCYINPVNCNVYSDAQYLEVIQRVNQLKPYGFSIVDTFGVLRKQDLSRIYYLVEGNLDPDIVIGVHLHENLGLALSLAQHFLEIRDPKRSVSVDCSLLGMGRVPGNLCAEQIMDHLNIYYGAEYNTEPAYDAIDDFIAPIKREIPWGYSVPYALSGKYKIHRTYPEYLLKKNRLKTKDIQRILRMVDKDHIEMFDESYIEDLYRKYITVDYDDTQSRSWLSAQIAGQKIVVLCPGKKLAENREAVLAEIEKNEAKVFSINFVPDFLEPDYVFCANVKRLPNVVDTEGPIRLITSNLIEAAENNYEQAFSFNDCVYFNEEFCEDSTLMLLKLLMECGCERVAIAGFDGFQDGAQNYYIPTYTREQGTNIPARKVKHILSNSLDRLHIDFLTPSAYQPIEVGENR